MTLSDLRISRTEIAMFVALVLFAALTFAVRKCAPEPVRISPEPVTSAP